MDVYSISICTIYIILSISGILSSLACLTSIYICRKLAKKNAFYFYVINLLVANSICLTGSGLYTGLAILQPKLLLTRKLQNFFAFVIDCSYYPMLWFHILICLTRLSIFGYPKLNYVMFNGKRLYLWALVLWILYLPSSIYYIFADEIILILDPELFTWYYNVDGSWFPRLLNQYNTYHNLLSLVLIIIVNCWTLILVRRQSRSIVINQRLQSRSLEVKLFVQCFISSMFYSFTVTLFAIIAQVKSPTVFCTVVAEILWILNDSATSVLFLILNTKFRSGLKNFFCKVLKVLCCNTRIGIIHVQSTNVT